MWTFNEGPLPVNAEFYKLPKPAKVEHRGSMEDSDTYELTIKKVTFHNKGFFECHGQDEYKHNFEARAELKVAKKSGKLVSNTCKQVFWCLRSSCFF